jgi:uncharacterized sulfatase
MNTTLLLIAITFASGEPAASSPPNVVMIVGDDMAWTDYGFMGHEHVQTPNIDRLASEGALFPNGYVPTSLCRASLATLLTGLFAHEHKICCNDPPKGVDRSLMLPFLRDSPTIPRLLGSQGYRSFQTGKFWEGPFENGGFTHGMTRTGRHGEEGLVIGRQTMQPIYDFITAAKGQPFFVWYAPMMPHQPHNPPERILKKYQADGRDVRQAKYWAMCEWFDETCGDLLKWLDDHNLRDNTLVVYVVDNGWIQATGPVKQGEQFLTRSKNTPYDAGVRTPVILHWPGRIKSGRCGDLVSTIDLAPTILAACGIKPPEKMSGVNLIDVANGSRPLRRDAVFGEIYTHDCTELGQPVLSVTHRWVRQADWKLIMPTKDKSAPELFHLVTDPHEKQNVAGSNSDRVNRLAKLLDGWWSIATGEE